MAGQLRCRGFDNYTCDRFCVEWGSLLAVEGEDELCVCCLNCCHHNNMQPHDGAVVRRFARFLHVKLVTEDGLALVPTNTHAGLLTVGHESLQLTRPAAPEALRKKIHTIRLLRVKPIYFPSSDDDDEDDSEEL